MKFCSINWAHCIQHSEVRIVIIIIMPTTSGLPSRNLYLISEINSGSEFKKNSVSEFFHLVVSMLLKLSDCNEKLQIDPIPIQQLTSVKSKGATFFFEVLSFKGEGSFLNSERTSYVP